MPRQRPFGSLFPTRSVVGLPPGIKRQLDVVLWARCIVEKVLLPWIILVPILFKEVLNINSSIISALAYPVVTIGLVAVMVAFLTAGIIVRQRLKRFIADNDFFVCIECGYPLQGLPIEHNCPECGAAYERQALRNEWKRWHKVR